MCQIEKRRLRSRHDGLELSLLIVKPSQSEVSFRGIVQFVHGMSEHKERYLPFMEYLAGQGFVTVIHDHRGHGKSVRSAEDLGYMYGGGAQALLDDIWLVQRYIRRDYPQLPVILFGHSMGSLAVRAFARRHDDTLDALIVCGSPSKNPARPLGVAIAQVQKLILGDRHRSKLIEALSFGEGIWKYRKEGHAAAWVCANPQTVQEYEESPLCGFTFTTDGYLVVFELMKLAYQIKGWRCTKPQLPILFVGGADDICIGGPRKFAAALNFMRMAGYYNVRGKLYPGMRHEILNEEENRKVFEDIGAFLKQKGF